MLRHRAASVSPSVPSLFRLTPISATKRCKPTITQIPAQRYTRRYRGHTKKSELYFNKYSAQKCPSMTLKCQAGGSRDQVISGIGHQHPSCRAGCGKLSTTRSASFTGHGTGLRYSVGTGSSGSG